MITNFLLYNIITRKHDICCICLKAIEGVSTNIEDDIFLENNEPKSIMKMQDILTLVLGYETLNNVSAFETLCQQCKHAAINSYKFIAMSRQNFEHLSNAIGSLNEATSIANVLEKTANRNKTLFVTLDKNNFTTGHYYDNKSFSSNIIALQNLHCILDAKSEIKKETAVKPEEIEIQNDNKVNDMLNKPPKYKKKSKYISISTKTREMLFDKSDPKTIKCKICFKLFPLLTTLRNHYLRVHAPKVYECSICHKKFGSIAIMKGHKRESHCTKVCSKCGKTFHNRHTFKIHEAGHNFKLVCQVCGRVYKSKSTFKKHIDLNICGQKTRASPANAKFTCDYCNKKYTQKVSLRVHIQYEHGNYKGHECRWCKKTFYAQSRLKAHIVKHTQEKKFLCNMCGGRFISKESLLYHTRTHTGEKPYKCDLCDNRFVSASRRSEHKKRRHTNLTVLSQHSQSEC